MFCRYCGNELPDDARFCNACGKSVDTGQQEQGPLQGPPQEESSSPEISDAVDTIKRPVQKNRLKKTVIIAIIVLGLVVLGALGMRAINETSMKQQVPQGIYEESKERVVNHYDKTMAYPYGNDLGYIYGCDFTTFVFTKGDTSNTFNVEGEMEVIDKSQEDRPSYRITIHGTVTTNFFRTDWSADWVLHFQDPVYESISYSDSSTPAISVNQFRNKLISYNGEYIQPHIPSESGGFTEGSGHVEVTVNLEMVSDNRMNASISVFSYSDSARIAEVSASDEVEMQPSITIEFDEDGWGNKGILHLLFLENGEIGVWSEITEYSEYANWGLDIGYVELAMSSK